MEIMFFNIFYNIGFQAKKKLAQFNQLYNSFTN